MTLPRFRIRTLMIAVAVVAIAATFGRPYDETTAMLALILATDLARIFHTPLGRHPISDRRHERGRSGALPAVGRAPTP